MAPALRSLFDHAWGRVRDHTGLGIAPLTPGVGLDDARQMHQRAYALGELSRMLPADIGHAAAYEAYRSWSRNSSMHGHLDDDHRQREGLIGLARRAYFLSRVGRWIITRAKRPRKLLLQLPLYYFTNLPRRAEKKGGDIDDPVLKLDLALMWIHMMTKFPPLMKVSITVVVRTRGPDLVLVLIRVHLHFKCEIDIPRWAIRLPCRALLPVTRITPHITVHILTIACPLICLLIAERLTHILLCHWVLLDHILDNLTNLLCSPTKAPIAMVNLTKLSPLRCKSPPLMVGEAPPLRIHNKPLVMLQANNHSHK
ncbi:hypothetical protein H0H92_008539 [Tricholoma furcatifolium]|nr:hypothetical protein H0H92_008539 [Tricholoma furcatifolium]